MWRGRSGVLALAALGCWLGGCAGPDLTDDPLLIPGTGELEFVALGPGITDLVLTSGVQGGTHVWGAARLAGVDWRDVTVSWTLLDAEGDEVNPTITVSQAFAACTASDPSCEPGMGELVAVPVVLDDPGALRGDELTMRMEAVDVDGRTAEASAQVRPVSQMVVE